MYKVTLPYNKFEEYCKYKDQAYINFYDAIDKEIPCNKFKAYKNGNRCFWFTNKNYKKVLPYLQSMEFESIVIEVRKLK